MKKGFFIVVVKARSSWTGMGKKREEYFLGNLLQPVIGWAKASGKTIEIVTDLQRKQYHDWLGLKKVVPALVGEDCGPMANGQTVRFVEVS